VNEFAYLSLLIFIDIFICMNFVVVLLHIYILNIYVSHIVGVYW